MKGAEDDMERDPGEEQPARPVVTTEHKRSTEYGEQPHAAAPDNFVWKRTQGLELGDVIYKSNDAGCYEHPTDDSD